LDFSFYALPYLQVDSLKKALAKKEAEVAQLQSMKESPLMDRHKLHTPVRPRRLSLEGPVSIFRSFSFEFHTVKFHQSMVKSFSIGFHVVLFMMTFDCRYKMVFVVMGLFPRMINW
jgi:hypothetical protein